MQTTCATVCSKKKTEKRKKTYTNTCTQTPLFFGQSFRRSSLLSFVESVTTEAVLNPDSKWLNGERQRKDFVGHIFPSPVRSFIPRFSSHSPLASPTFFSVGIAFRAPLG
jgi:hypothetical protein